MALNRIAVSVVVLSATMFLKPVRGQTPPLATEVTKWIDATAETYTLDTAQMSKTEFQHFFQSSEFEKLLRTRGGSNSISIGFKGASFGFGGSQSSSEAWEKRAKNVDSNEWEFETRTNTKITLRKSDPEVLKQLQRIVETLVEKPGGGQDGLSVSAEAKSDTVEVQIKFKPRLANGQAPIPTVQAIDGVGVDLTTAKLLVGRPLDAETAVLNLPWENGAAFATFLLKTDAGLLTTYVERATARTCLLEYDYEEWSKVGEVSDRFTAKCGEGSHPLPDWARGIDYWPQHGDLMAAKARGHLTVAGDQKLQRVSAVAVDGAALGGRTDPNHSVALSPDGKSADAEVTVWVGNSTILFSADVYGMKRSRSRKMQKIIPGGTAQFVVPDNNTSNGSVTFFWKDEIHQLPLGESDDVYKCASPEKSGGLVTYTYSAVK